MLNLSRNSIGDKIKASDFKAFSEITPFKAGRVLAIILLVFLGCFILFLFLPWTQNIRADGIVTSLSPEHRPQTIHSVIGGRIDKWFVNEGDYVSKGDTIMYITEVKDKYFDPELLQRTEQQIKAKESSVKSYMEKITALDQQIDALLKIKKLKLEQANNKLRQAELKVKSDSMDFEAEKINFDVATKQYERMKQLYEGGLKSLTDLETRKLKFQQAQAKLISAENKLLISRNEFINARVELSSINNQYRDKISKAESDKYSALSNMYDAEAIVTKLQNEYMNYSVRIGMYYVTAPQDGYITRAIKTGVGELIKEGDEIISIMPKGYELAVEMYVKPMDLPLIKKGQRVQFMFDGWPSIVFSGWPNLSYGTFTGKVVAIDNFVIKNGSYRILVAPDEDQAPWPEALRIGSGAEGMALLTDVPLWYELWRQLNGFPPDYYKQLEDDKKEDKKK